MEPNESGLSSYYHHQQQQRHLQQPQPPHQQSPTGTATASNIVFVSTSPNNGNLPNTERATHLVYPQAASVTPPAETVKRKRGRPRKYATPEEAAAAKRVVSSAAVPMSPKKKDQSFGGSSLASSSSSSKKTQLAALGNAGQGFTPHVISVAAGEDVYQKIMLLMQQSKCEICILSASGSISNPSLRQPATSGGNITYEGRFDIISLSGSYICTELGGRTGGLSACLSSTDGQIIGGGIGGPLRAAGPVQVIVGRFLIETKKDVIANAGAKGNEHTDNQLK